MMKLYIGGMLVHLPSNFSTEYYTKSPYFTNEGDFTLNIDLDLKDPANARAYAYLHRIDRTKKPSRREAVLQDETGVVIRGKEILLEVNDMKASIQIVAGASELNYEIGDRKLRDLDLWSAFGTDEVEFFPVCAFNETEHAEWGLMTGDEYVTEDGVKQQKWAIANRPRMRNGQYEMNYEVGQPFFWAIVERVVAALGFEVGTNVLKTDTRYNRMVMVHAIRSQYIADILPDWTVTKLFNEVQKFFNVIIVVDKATRRVDIIHAWNFFTTGNMEVVKHNDVVTVDKNYDNGDEMTMVNYEAAHYAFTGKDINKYNDISEELKAVCVTRQGVSVSTGDAYDRQHYSYLWQAIPLNASWQGSDSVPLAVEGEFGKRVLYKDTFFGEERTFVLASVEDDLCLWKMVDAFGAKETRRKGATDVEMAIVPARMASSPLQGRDGQWWQYPLPAVDGEASSYKGHSWGGGGSMDTAPDVNINDDIKSGYKEEKSNRADVMFAAFYLGELNPSSWEASGNNVPSAVKLPLAAPDWQVQLMRLRGAPGSSRFWKSARQVRLGTETLTMAIKGTNGMDAYTYSKNNAVDTSVAYTIRFRSHKQHDVRKVWLIDNRLFYCRELKFSIDDGKRSELVEGVFLPLVVAGQAESGEAEYYVSYNLSRVLVDGTRVTTVNSGETLHVDLKLTAGGSGSSTLQGMVQMGGVDITSSAFHQGSSWGTAYVEIASVTGDVFIQAWRT